MSDAIHHTIGILPKVVMRATFLPKVHTFVKIITFEIIHMVHRKSYNFVTFSQWA